MGNARACRWRRRDRAPAVLQAQQACASLARGQPPRRTFAFAFAEAPLALGALARRQGRRLQKRNLARYARESSPPTGICTPPPGESRRQPARSEVSIGAMCCVTAAPLAPQTATLWGGALNVSGRGDSVEPPVGPPHIATTSALTKQQRLFEPWRPARAWQPCQCATPAIVLVTSSPAPLASEPWRALALRLARVPLGASRRATLRRALRPTRRD